MKTNSFGGYHSINSYVKAKLKSMDSMESSFSSLFTIMFSESENIMYEKSSSYKIEKTSYGESRQRIFKRAFYLKKMLEDLPHNSVVGLYMQNSLEWIELFWAILCCGFCPLLMNTRLNTDCLEDSLKYSGAAAVISDSLGFSVRTVSSSEIISENLLSPEHFGENILVMSSGTSSNLKICSYTADEFRHLIRDSFGIIKECSTVKKHYEGQLKLLTFLPFYHVFGLIAVYIWFAFFARTFVHLPDMSPHTILGTIRRHKVTHIFAVPLFWEKVYNEAIRTIKNRGESTLARFEKGMRLADMLGDIPLLGTIFSRFAFREVRENLFGDSISFMISGGSNINRDVLRFFNNIGYPLVNGYGMTEIGITSVELSSRRSIRTAAFVGKPLSSVEYLIDNRGELLVRGSSLALRINEGGTSNERSEDWFRTGDLAECIKGHYRILGRMDDLIIDASGENLNPNLIESKLMTAEADKLCLIKDSEGNAVLLVSMGRHVSEDKLKKTTLSLKNRIGELELNGQIKKIVPIEGELMEADEFKINRSRLSREYINGSLPVVSAVSKEADPLDDPIYAHIVELFSVALEIPVSEISAETDFFLDGGGSSLDYFVLVERLRDEYSIDITSVEGVSLSSPAAIYKHLRVGD